jgi:hypothetical protein
MAGIKDEIEDPGVKLFIRDRKSLAVIAWLRDQLADGEKPCNEIVAAAKANNLARSRRDLIRAKYDAGIRSVRHYGTGSQWRHGPWYWCLPERGTDDV